jgi:hypothetical protein
MDHLRRDELIQWRDHGHPEDRDRIVSHLATCASCAAMYAELIRTAPVASGPARFDPRDFVKRGYAVRRDASTSAWPAIVSSWKVWAGALSAAVVIIFLAPRFDSNSGAVRDTDSFTTLSGSSGFTSGVRLTVMFQPDVTEEALRRTLLEIEGNVVAGPSATGVYLVQLPGHVGDDREVQIVLDKLRGNRKVIRFAEREP